MKWKSTDIIEIIQEKTNKQTFRQDDPYPMNPYKSQLHTSRILNQNRSLISKEPIITIPRSILGVGIAIVAFSIIPSIPIIIGALVAYWIAKQSNN